MNCRYLTSKQYLTINMKQCMVIEIEIIQLFSKFCLDKGRKGHQVPDHVDEDDSPGEGKVDGGVCVDVQHRVQLHPVQGQLDVLFIQVVCPIHVSTSSQSKIILVTLKFSSLSFIFPAKIDEAGFVVELQTVEQSTAVSWLDNVGQMVDEFRHGGEGSDGATAEDEKDDEHVDADGGAGVGALDHQHDAHGDLFSVDVAGPQG